MDGLSSPKILIIDADSSVTEPVCAYFHALGASCRAAKTLAEGRAYLAEGGYDAAISELFLPDGKGTELLGSLPLVIFSAEKDDEEIVNALSLGAADYILKPCSPRVLAARLFKIVPPRKDIVSRYGLTLDLRFRSASYLGQPVKLTSSEFNILFFLMTHRGEYFTADEIYERVWNAPSLQTGVVRFHISNLKKALFAATGKNMILSGFGVGYAFAAEEPQTPFWRPSPAERAFLSHPKVCPVSFSISALRQNSFSQ